MKQVVPIPKYAPDQSVNSGVALVSENVLPAADGVIPIKAYAPASDALAGTFLGGFSCISIAGVAYLLAGTGTTLESLSSGVWSDLLTSLTVTGRWRFEQFGNVAIGVNGGATKVVNLAAGTAADLTAAPTGTSIMVVGNHVVIGQADGNILRVEWSAFGDHTAWTPGTDQAGFQPMLTGGEVMGLAGGEYGIILQRQRLVRMSLTGDAEAPFQFDEITNNFGCAAKASIAQAGRTVFFLSDRGFIALDDGQAIRPIGNEVIDRTFAAQVSRDDLERMFAGVDPQNTLVFWAIPGTPGTIFIYNWALDRWSTGKLNLAGLFAGYLASSSLESVSAVYTNLDTMPFSLDDPRFAGGAPRFYIAGTDGTIGTLSGDNLAASIALGFTQFTPGRRSRIRHVRPIGDVVDGMTLTLDARARLGDRENLTTTQTLRTSGAMPVRCNGRYIKTRLDIAAATDWSYLQGFEMEFTTGGQQ